MLRSSCLAWMLPMKHICYLLYNRSGCSSWLSFITVVIQAHASCTGCQSRFLSAFYPKGGKMRLYGLLGGGKYVFMCKACGKLRASARGACPGKWSLLIDAIWWNLGLQEYIPPPYIFQTVYSIPSWSHAYLCSFSRYEGCLWIRVLRFRHTARASAHGL